MKGFLSTLAQMPLHLTGLKEILLKFFAKIGERGYIVSLAVLLFWN